MPKRLAPLLALAAFALAARAENPRLAPIPKEEAVSTHGPYEMGACETCHQRHDAANPGPALKVSNDLCYECHDEFKGSAPVKMEKADHPAVKAACTTCHNPHNARKKRLRM
jgi:predicted CXXCH cytochrome family protein